MVQSSVIGQLWDEHCMESGVMKGIGSVSGVMLGLGKLL